MKITHIRADGTRCESMAGVKAPPTANKIRSEVTFGEVLRKEERKLEEMGSSSCVGNIN